MPTDDPPYETPPHAAPLRTTEDRTRDALVAAGVIAAAAALWALALGVLDQGPPTAARHGSPAARVERKPVLFVVRPDGARPPAVGTAIPIAALDPGGVLRPPIPQAASDDARRAVATSFAADYLREGTPLQLLSGGAAAGALQLDGESGTPSSVPTASVTTDPTSRADVLTAAADDLLALSDMRYGALTSGARPLRAAHRAEVERLARDAVKERYPNAQILSLEATRIRVADLDRIGRPELLASLTVHLRTDAHRDAVVALFLVGEAVANAETFRLAYDAVLEDAGPKDGFVYVDQVDLTASPFDEVVVRIDRAGSTRYAILERGADGWTEAVSSSVASAG